MLEGGSVQNVALQEAIEALRKGDRARARDILTRQLKTSQDNAQCWIWLSSAVDSQKERLYCLQTALQLDPQNTAAKRGLILLGGLPPDESVPPFPLNRPRAWEEKLVLPKEAGGKSHGLGNTIVRLLLVIMATGAALAFVYFGFLAPNAFALPLLNRPRYQRITATFTITGTIYPTTLPTLSKPSPLAMLLESTYTPTPMYVVTEHPITTSSSFDAGLRFFNKADYQNAISMFQQVLKTEPDAADVYYYIGESYRLQEDFQNARSAYQTAININPDFAPSYLGRALVTEVTNPDADVSPDLDSAILLDPKYTDAYVERGSWRRTHNDPTGAAQDELYAIGLNPNSALAHMVMAQIQLDTGQNEAALAFAKRANEIDLTLVQSYLVLAQAYIANGQPDLATETLRTYTLYTPADLDAYLPLSQVYNAIGQYQAALDAVNKYLNDNPRSPEGYYQRGVAYLNLKSYSLAEIDFKTGFQYNPAYFDACLGLSRAYFAEDHAGNAYTQANLQCEPLAKADSQKAQVFYWEANYLEKLGETNAAKETWRHLLMFPESAMPAEWRQDAFLHLGIKPTLTATLRYTLTPKPTGTPIP